MTMTSVHESDHEMIPDIHVNQTDYRIFPARKFPQAGTIRRPRADLYSICEFAIRLFCTFAAKWLPFVHYFSLTRLALERPGLAGLRR